MENQIEKTRSFILAELLGKIAAGIAIAFVIYMIIITTIGTFFQIAEGPSPLQELISDWPKTIFFLIISTPLAIFGGLYGGKIASTNPRKSGWLMFLIGLISLFDLQYLAGIVLIIAGIYTILFQKPITQQK